MGWFDAEADVERAQNDVNAAQRAVNAQKANIATAKKSGNYQRAPKNNSYNGKKGNTYDLNLWLAQDELKKAKERLANANAKAKAEKAKSKSSSSRSSKNSSSSSSSRSSKNSSSSSYSSYDDEVEETPEERRAREEAERARAEELRQRKEMNEKMYKYYVETYKRRFKVDEASDVELGKMLPEILAEMQDMIAKRKECSDSLDANLFSRIAKEAKTIGIAAYKRLEKLNKSLFKKPEVQEVVKKIDPDYTDGFFKKIFRLLFDVRYASRVMTKNSPLASFLRDDDE